jgi:uracil phosphoribosyltransferase
MSNFKVIDHPLIKHKITQIRDENTSSKSFRELVDEIASLMCYEITRDVQVQEIKVKTPVDTTIGHQLTGYDLTIVPILRAGLGMVDGILKLIPTAKTGHIGLYRDPVTLQPVEYLCKLPGEIDKRDILVVDPMLATGGSASMAIDMLKKRGAKNIKLVCLVGCPEGVNFVNEKHPDVQIYLAALDSHLNDHGYIVPGLGDAGDRLFGTK